MLCDENYTKNQTYILHCVLKELACVKFTYFFTILVLWAVFSFMSALV